MTIKELNENIKANGGSWIAEENEISQLPDSVLIGMLGLDNPKEYDLTEPSPIENLHLELLPSSVDWRDYNGKNYVTSVKSQGYCGSCVGFGSTSTFESAIAIEHKMLIDLSEADGFFCSDHGLSCKGWSAEAFFNANKERGICESALFPYSAAFKSNPKVPECIVNPLRNKNAFKYNKIIPVNTHAETKKYLAEIGPLTAGFVVYSDFYAYKSGIYKVTPGATFKGNHCISIVGYNDADGGYYICKNSWKPTWGNNGYFYIAYGQCKMDTIIKYGVTQTTLPELKLHNFKCLGDISLPNNIYLNGNIDTRTVNLVSSTDPSVNPGTYWEIEHLGKGIIALKCFGETMTGKFMYLNGNTSDGTVSLAPTTTGENKGTHWTSVKLPDGSFTYKCLGGTEKENHVYLDGNRQIGTVSLAPAVGSSYTGTHWAEDGFAK